MIRRRARHARSLTEGEKALARGMFGDAIDLDRVEVRRAKWWPFQPRATIMAPLGHIHLHPESTAWREDYAAAEIWLRALFLHELTHVWQHQRGLFLPIRRHPFCRYGYTLAPGRRLERYGIEQQAEIVQRTYLLRLGFPAADAAALAAHEAVVAEAFGG